jgi:hypothetical protein
MKHKDDMQKFLDEMHKEVESWPHRIRYNSLYLFDDNYTENYCFNCLVKLTPMTQYNKGVCIDCSEVT